MGKKNKNKLQKPSEPKAQDQKNKVFRTVKQKADTDKVVVRTELGYDLVFNLHPQIRVAPYDAGKNGAPEFQTQIMWTLVGIRPKANAMKMHEITNLIKDRSVLNMDMEFDIIQLGFVYSNQKDPNNHRWWIEALKAGSKMGEFTSLVSEYPLNVRSDAPIGTRSWFDGIYHGRFTYNKDFVETLIEEQPGYVYIKGNGKGKLGDIGGKKPDDDIFAYRVRFDIRKNVWYAEPINNEHQLMENKGTLVGQQVKSDAPFKGQITIDKRNPARPKVSGVILRDDVDQVKEENKIIWIKGKNG